VLFTAIVIAAFALPFPTEKALLTREMMLLLESRVSCDNVMILSIRSYMAHSCCEMETHSRQQAANTSDESCQLL